MSVHAYNATDDTNAVRDTWDAEFGLNPTEETKVADWVSQPVADAKVGRTLYLRKIPAFSAQTYTSHASNGKLEGLTSNLVDLERVQADAVMQYGLVQVDRAIMNRVVEDGAFRAGLKKQLMASINEARDSALFALASSASLTESGSAIDDAMVRSALGQLAGAAKNKFTTDAPKLLVVDPSELKNVWNIPAIKEFQIRGSAGSAVNLKMNAYNTIWRESGLVLDSAGTLYNPLLLKEGWALAHNEKPHILETQFDGLNENFIAVVEYAVCEWFDSCVVSLNIT